MSKPGFEIRLIKLPVSDLDAASEFYARQLGFEVEFAAEEYGWAQLSAGGLAMALYRPGMGGGDRKPGGTADFHLALPSEAFEPLAQRLLEAGHLAEDRIHTGDDGTTFVDVRDPDGNIIKIFKS